MSNPLHQPTSDSATHTQTQRKRWVIKLGTRVLSDNSDCLSRPRIVDLMRQIAQLRREGYEITLVSSGAVLAGWEHLGYPTRQNTLGEKQFLAAVGQSQLMSLYTQLGAIYDLKVAQTLLVRSDFSDRRRYLNARNTFEACFANGVIPVVNENDVVAIEEIKLGDNDNLGAQVASLVQADRLILCSDIDGLYSAPPQSDPQARFIAEVPTIDAEIHALAGDALSKAGTGGMRTKIQAAEIATRAGGEMWIVNGAQPDILLELMAQERNHAPSQTVRGTCFLPQQERVQARKRWILSDTCKNSRLIIDKGAVDALLNQGKSLLPAGIIHIEGHFEKGRTIRVFDEANHELARGLVQYNSEELLSIAGKHSKEISAILGYTEGAEVMHRNDMVLLDKSVSTKEPES